MHACWRRGVRDKKLQGDSRVITDDTVTKPKPLTASELFDEMCPVYMAYGMTYDEFWHCDPKAYIAYREAHKLDIKRRNEEMWLQGRYNFEAFYTALSNLHLDGKSHKINKYLKEPFEMFKKSEIEKKADAEKARQTIIDRLNAFKAMWDAKKAKG